MAIDAFDKKAQRGRASNIVLYDVHKRFYINRKRGRSKKQYQVFDGARINKNTNRIRKWFARNCR